jgi:hypothetical protein
VSGLRRRSSNRSRGLAGPSRARRLVGKYGAGLHRNYLVRAAAISIVGILGIGSRREPDEQRQYSLQDWQSYKLRDDGDVPLICPTSQNVFREQKSMPTNPFLFMGFLTLHGVVFDI